MELSTASEADKRFSIPDTTFCATVPLHFFVRDPNRIKPLTLVTSKHFPLCCHCRSRDITVVCRREAKRLRHSRARAHLHCEEFRVYTFLEARFNSEDGNRTMVLMDVHSPHRKDGIGRDLLHHCAECIS